MDEAWFQRHSTLCHTITAAVLVTLTLICAYFLWRGSHRSKFPCFRSRRHRPTPSTSTTFNRSSSLPSSHEKPTLPGASNTDWKGARQTSKAYLSHLESSWEGRQGQSRKITKLRPKSPSTPTSAHTFGHGRSGSKSSHVLSMAPTTSSFGQSPDQSTCPASPALPSSPALRSSMKPVAKLGLESPQSIIEFTAAYPQPTPFGSQLDSASPFTPYTPYSPPSAYPATPPLAYFPSSSSTSLAGPRKVYVVPHPFSRSSMSLRIEGGTLDLSPRSLGALGEERKLGEGRSSSLDFSRPIQPYPLGGSERETVFSTASVYSQATVPPPQPDQHRPPSQSAEVAPPAIQLDTPPIVGTSNPSFPTPHPFPNGTEDQSIPTRPSTTPIPAQSTGVTVPSLAKVKRASYAASRMSMRSVKPPPSPLRQLVA